MRTKTILSFLAGCAALMIIAGAFSAGLLVGFNWPSPANQGAIPGPNPVGIAPTTAPSIIGSTGPEYSEGASTPQDLEEIFAPFWQAWQIIHDRYVDQPLDDLALMRGAIDGMLQTLGDEHTSYMDPDTLMQSSISLEGEYQGIGAWVDTDSEYLTIVSPMPGSPAERAGLKPGDEIIAIDGEDMTGIDGNLVIRRVLGPAGTSVRLTVRREGQVNPLEFEVVRELITIPSITSEMLEGNIAYVRLMRFGDQSAADLRAALEELLEQRPDGLILDLRFNGGGFLTSAIDVASEFIPDGVLMYEEYGNGSRDILNARPGGLATEIPLVVLVNEGSASASEIVAGAIQDYNRGLLVGVQTFGKGSVQVVEPLGDNQGAVRVTIARWLTPNERQINESGLEPDIEVEISEEDVAAERDPQLDKAIELLTIEP